MEVHTSANNGRPENVGIIAADIYFPRTFVNQEELEKHNGVSAGKYTKGLMQTNMAVCSDLEDVVSMSLTVCENLLKKHNIDAKDIGHLEVGTESSHDNSKSAKSFVMDLLTAQGNTNVEGADCKNACYGGTAALFHAVNWVESSQWDGRYALVIAADIAVYAEGHARPTGGAGAVAMLIGPDAPLTFEPGLRCSYSANVYDFYKPNMASEYPVVDGQLSVQCYLHALVACHHGLANKIDQQEKFLDGDFLVTQQPYLLLHAPFGKMVLKAFCRMIWCDYKRHPNHDPALAALMKPFDHLGDEESLQDRALEKALKEFCKDKWTNKVAPGLLSSQQLGNLYCGSLYGSLVSLLCSKEDLKGKRILLFSYGSGICSTLFTMRIRKDANWRSIVKKVNLHERLADRIQLSVEDYLECLTAREKALSTRPHKPSFMLQALYENAHCLAEIDELGRRSYVRVDGGDRSREGTETEEIEDNSVNDVEDLSKRELEPSEVVDLENKFNSRHVRRHKTVSSLKHPSSPIHNPKPGTLKRSGSTSMLLRESSTGATGIDELPHPDGCIIS